MTTKQTLGSYFLSLQALRQKRTTTKVREILVLSDKSVKYEQNLP